jgi:hypothetical protein
VLLASGGDSIFHKELPVAESIVGRIPGCSRCREARRDDLDIHGGDDFKTLAHAVVVRGYAAIVGLPMDVVANSCSSRGVVVACGVIRDAVGSVLRIPY